MMTPEEKAYFRGASEILAYIIRTYGKENGEVHLSAADQQAVREHIGHHEQKAQEPKQP